MKKLNYTRLRYKRFVMKKPFPLLLFLCPLITIAQQSRDKSSPQDYIWMNLGNPEFSPGTLAYTSIGFSPSDGQPYVAYKNENNFGKAPVMKFNGQQLITQQIIQPKTQIDISSLPEGIYFVRLTSDKNISMGKFIVLTP